ncbi:UBL3-like, ubiquitin domain [Dillenia turbinata]|uniref:UBL3-like, ubiquitin domain n=1 Tax=Dillenia turbinata TaxID=194707 RepID=A0AAN8YUB6_9MAGN
MSGVQDQLEIKFRLTDGSDIGPKSFPVATSVATLKESILAQWPKDKENGPRTIKDVKLICAGRILENNRTVGECRSPLCDVPGGVTTMHVVIQAPPSEKGAGIVSQYFAKYCCCSVHLMAHTVCLLHILVQIYFGGNMWDSSAAFFYAEKDHT